MVKCADDQTWSYILKYGGIDESASDLAAIASLCEENEMQNNENKSCEMSITTTRLLSPLLPSRINGKALNRVEFVKILGLILSSDLKWQRDINSNISKCSRLTYALERSNDLTYLFEPVFVPTLLYCCRAWCNLLSVFQIDKSTNK